MRSRRYSDQLRAPRAFSQAGHEQSVKKKSSIMITSNSDAVKPKIEACSLRVAGSV